MNAAQRDRIIAIVSKDANARGQYETGDGRTCAIGGLAKAAHIARPRPALNEKVIKDKSLAYFCERLVKTYGVHPDELREIQRHNDTNLDIDDRRAAIIRYVRALTVTP